MFKVVQIRSALNLTSVEVSSYDINSGKKLFPVNIIKCVCVFVCVCVYVYVYVYIYIYIITSL